MNLILAVEKKLDMEKTAVSSTPKLPKLKIRPSKGTAGNWVRFENMFRQLSVGWYMWETNMRV